MTSRVQDMPVAKPMELLAARDEMTYVFSSLQDWFEMPPAIESDVSAVDSTGAVSQFTDRVLIAGMAMRKLQALHYIAEPGIITGVDVVVSLIDGVLHALFEAPDSYLERRAALCDWDQELASLDRGLIWQDPKRTDEELDKFRQCIAVLIEIRQLVADIWERGYRLLR